MLGARALGENALCCISEDCCSKRTCSGFPVQLYTWEPQSPPAWTLKQGFTETFTDHLTVVIILQYLHTSSHDTVPFQLTQCQFSLSETCKQVITSKYQGGNHFKTNFKQSMSVTLSLPSFVGIKTPSPTLQYLPTVARVS